MLDQWLLKPLRHPQGWRANVLTQALALALSSQACSAFAADYQSDSQALELAPVTVSARLNQESARDIPFGLSVIDGQTLQTRRLRTLEDALRGTPGVDVNSWGGANDANVRIRGVGSLNQMSMDDGSVVLNVDGVPMSVRNAAMASLDVQQVEVLKGPQGTLLGRNSEAGAINVTTRKPTREVEGYVRGEVGQQGQFMTEGAVGGPLTETLAGRVAVRRSGFDNWVDDQQDRDPLTAPRDLALRGSLLWDNDAGTTGLLVAERQRAEHYVGLEMLRPFGDSPRLDYTPGVFDGNQKTNERYSFELNHDLAQARITSISAYTSTDFNAVKGYDRNITRALYGSPFEYLIEDSAHERVWSQDLRLGSLPEAEVFWVSGVNLSRSERNFDSNNFTNGALQQREFTTNSYAAYGEITFPIAEDWKLTTGLRHTWDRKTYGGEYTSAGNRASDSRQLQDNYSTGRVALAYALTPQTNLYAVLSRGYKSAGFNDYATSVTDSEPYKAAKVSAAEMGFKHESEGGALSLEGALFFTRVRDDHLLGYDFKTVAVSAVNADTRSKGAELSSTWHVTDQLTLGSAVSYTNALVTSDARGVSGGDVVAGSRVPDVPLWSGNFSVAWHKDLPDLLGLPAPRLNTLLNYRLQKNRPADPQNHYDLKGYAKLDLHLGLESGGSEVYLWGDNLLDARYDLYGAYSTAQVLTGMPGRGRSAGVGYSYSF
ncbi:TonB-dependent receptor [Pseudomonas sp. FH4]|jgi:iron complex outermembrane receptor protein|uniref:Iron complex outermembrane recepter protein n=1 Tax=Pseudomonas brenneri TaxID=129817 RepID=A0A5B2V4Z5_9PSED|nr:MULTISPECIES: TonB-dependent receptor [Pseudomonas fluorescens group]KAA6178499.1 TonB-dependent receptor [Pseudomonas marginalis]ETK17252.1 TonB-dependent receptor [Pseudomonas sp. FH4]KAA2233908.1 TonB-dependent receptor [Pseudomonas brenneri]MBF8005687.1 TonB-dependent receptor [Pseudomonas brenneri]TWR81858.1 TonB-dependent receptor [Pseudomonas brenneri]